MTTKSRVAIGIALVGMVLCFGLWRHGTVAKGTAYRVTAGTDEIYAYRFVVRERLSIFWAMRHPVAARRVRGEAYAAVSGVIDCLPGEPTRNSVGPATAHVSAHAQLPILLTVLDITRLGKVMSNGAEASMLRSECSALLPFDPSELTTPSASL